MHHEVADGGKDAASLTNSAHNGGKVVVSQHDVSHALGDVGAGDTHGDAHVRLLDGRRIVHAVASHRRNLATPVQRLHHAHLTLGGAACHNEGELGHLVKVIVTHGVHLRSGGDDALRGGSGGDNANLLRNGLGSRGMVAREHAHNDTSGEALLHSGDGGLLGGVTDGDEGEEAEVALHITALEAGDISGGVIEREVGALGDSEDAEALRREVVHAANELGVGHGVTGAAREDGLRGALYGAQAAALGVVPAGAHGLGLGVEIKGAASLPASANGVKVGNRLTQAVGDLPGSLHQRQLSGGAVALEVVSGGVELHHGGTAAEDKRAEGVAESLRGIGRQRGEGGGPCGLAAVGGSLGDELLHGSAIRAAHNETSGTHLAFGQGSSLVGANVGDLAQLLERSHLADNRVRFSHTAHRDSHGDGDKDDGSLGEDGDQGGGRIQQRLVRNLPLECPKDKDAEDDADEKQAIHQTLHGGGQGGLLVSAATASEARSDFTDLSVIANEDDHAAAAALRDGGLTESHVGTVTDGNVLIFLLGMRQSRQGLDHRHALSCQAGLVDFQTVHLHHTEVSRNDVALLQLDDVTHDDVGERNLLRTTVTHNGGVGCTTQVLDRIHTLFGLVLLNN
mmetsp:Transcript_32869/g.58900  ORF Transcript_32869/g.58900 Transcript_32869/m.58900 type:complete len:624 (-) Transcript_32869:383-2254(-)